MYLSRILLDTDLRNTKRALASPQRMHAIVATCFDKETIVQRPLWRIDTLHGSTYLLLVSGTKPDFSSMIEQLASPDSREAITKNYDPFLDSIDVNDIYRFRLCANPVHSVARESGESTRGKVYGHVTVEQQKEWLENRAKKYGFKIMSFDVTSRSVRRFKRQDQTVTLAVASYEGLLQVVDSDLLRKALVEGIGRAKAYGCGLLTLAKQ